MEWVPPSRKSTRRCIPLGAECRRHTVREEPRALHRFLAPVVGRIVQEQRRHAGAGLQLAQAGYYGLGGAVQQGASQEAVVVDRPAFFGDGAEIAAGARASEVGYVANDRFLGVSARLLV